MAGNTSDQALILAYNQTIGRDPTAAELALGQQQLQAGTAISTIRAYLATTGDAYVSISAIYDDVVGRSLTYPEAVADEAYLAGGGNLANLRTYLSTSNEALDKLYTDVVERDPTTGELSSEVAAINTGTITFDGLRSYFATTTEAASKLQTLYQTELGRTVTLGELTGDEQLIANGASLAAIRGYLSTSVEAANAFDRQYQAMFGGPPDAADLTTGKQLLAGGDNLQFAAAEATYTTAFKGYFQLEYGFLPALPDLLAGAENAASGVSQAQAVANTPTSDNLIYNTFSTLLDVRPSLRPDLGAAIQAIADDVTASVTMPGQHMPNPVAVVTAVVAASPEFSTDVNAAIYAALGRPANAIETAADRTELGLGAPSVDQEGAPAITIDTLRAQIAELSGGVSPFLGGMMLGITPQTIAGNPGIIYGLYNNDALISSQPETVFSGGISGFNPQTDVLQIKSRQAPNFGSLTITEEPNGSSQNSYTQITLPDGQFVTTLYRISATSLTPANFRFV